MADGQSRQGIRRLGVALVVTAGPIQREWSRMTPRKRGPQYYWTTLSRPLISATSEVLGSNSRHEIPETLTKRVTWTAARLT